MRWGRKMNVVSVEKLLGAKIQSKEDMTPKQKAVLEAAITLFAERGFSATSTSEIAKAAKVSEGTIFKYFETKEKLLYTTVMPILVSDVLPIFAEQFKMDVLEKNHLTFEAFVSMLIDDRFAFIKENIELFKIIFLEMMYRAELKEVFVSTFMKSLQEPIFTLLGRFKAEKIIVDWDAMVIIRTIFTNLLGYVIPRFFVFPEHQWNDEVELQNVKAVIVKALTP